MVWYDSDFVAFILGVVDGGFGVKSFGYLFVLVGFAFACGVLVLVLCLVFLAVHVCW